jgi:quinoprotein glucose dehydrogenase
MVQGFADRILRLVCVLIGLAMMLIGLALAILGGRLVMLGGSAYYVPAGLGLLASGWLLCRGRRSGFWLYLLVVGLTAIWAVWEVGLEPWGLLPRLLAPVVLLALLAPLAPLLKAGRQVDA